MKGKEAGIYFDPSKCSYSFLETMARTVLNDPQKALILKHDRDPSVPVHANHVPELNDPHFDRDSIISGLIFHLKTAEKIVPVIIEPTSS